MEANEPFKVVLVHRLRGDTGEDQEAQGGLTVRNDKALREEQIAVFPASRYAWGGEYYVRVRIKRGKDLVVESGARKIDVAAWSVSDASSAKLRPPGQGSWFAFGVGSVIVRFTPDSASEETLNLNLRIIGK